MSLSTQSQYHAFNIRPELLEILIPRDIINQVQEPSGPDFTEPIAPAPSALGARACNICLNATFTDVNEQRAHFRSDWHRYNVKVRLSGGSPVSETQFSQLVDGLEDSISGSASSSSEDDSDGSDAVNNLVNKIRKLGRSPSPDSQRMSGPQTPLVWFHSPPSTQIAVYRALFSKSAPPSEYLSELKEMQNGGEHGRTWAMFMTAGGHFAGAIVRVKAPDGEDEEPTTTKKGKPRKTKPEVEVLKHKTFHRYTTRRKQGGSQGLNDNSKAKAISAGAMLRRYGEQALRDDIRSLLSDWAEEINDCERIWIRASVSNRRIFLDYEGSIFQKGDERLRTFPFPTRRPTQSELSRCLLELTRVKMSHLTEDALRAQDEAYLATLAKARPKVPAPAPPHTPEPVKEKPPTLTREEELHRENWVRLLDMVSRGRLDALKSFWEREGGALGDINAAVPEWMGERGGTLLQVAARAGQSEVLQWLLEEQRADPTIDVPIRGAVEEDGESDASDSPSFPKSGRTTAYDLASTRAVRDVFRRCAGAHPEWWDWLGTEHGARVPSILSAEMEEGREEKKKARRKGLKDRVKEREAKEKEREKTRSPSPAPVEEIKKVKKQVETMEGPRRLGGTLGASEGIAGLTPEMRVKVERERRARAAEARLRTLGATH